MKILRELNIYLSCKLLQIWDFYMILKLGSRRSTNPTTATICSLRILFVPQNIRWVANIRGHMIVSHEIMKIIDNLINIDIIKTYDLIFSKKMFRIFDNRWKKYEPTHELWKITSPEWPYYNSKVLVEYFDKTIEKKHWLQRFDIVIHIDSNESDDWKKFLKWIFEVIINWKKKRIKFDFSTWSNLPQKLWKIEHKIDKFISKNSIAGNLVQILNTKRETISKYWNIITFADGTTVDCSAITLNDVKNHPNCWFIYGSNLAWILWGWQAMYWSEKNAFWIPTRPDLNWYFSDKDFFKLKPEIDKSFEKIFDFIKEWKPVIIPANWVWTGFAKLQTHAPNILQYINWKLQEIKEQNKKYWLIITETSNKKVA